MEMKFGRMFAGVAIATVALAMPAFAADVPPLEAPVVEKPHHDWDVAFGVTFTSDYIARGYTQTAGGPAVQPWAELDIGKFYLGYWGSNVVNDWEHDLSIGFRPVLGPVTLDIGYVQYLYSNTATSGEIYGKASINPWEPLTVGIAGYIDPNSKNTYVEGNGAIALGHNVSLSGAVGVQSYGDGVTPSVTSWNAGASWAPKEWVKVDGRYYGGPTANKFVVALSFSTSFKSIGIFK